MTLIQTVQSLQDSTTKRNGLIEGYKTEFANNTQELVPRYFGFPYGGGHVNLDYPNTIEAIYRQTDDGIFFSNLLCKDLHIHGKHLTDEFTKKFKKDAPRVSEVDFAAAVASALMPDAKDYDDWTTAFVKKV